MHCIMLHSQLHRFEHAQRILIIGFDRMLLHKKKLNSTLWNLASTACTILKLYILVSCGRVTCCYGSAYWMPNNRAVPIILFFLPIILFRIPPKMLLLFPRIALLFSIIIVNYSHQELRKVCTKTCTVANQQLYWVSECLVLFSHQESDSQSQ